MANKKISEFTQTSAVGTSVVPVSDAAGTVTNKVTLADIAALGGGAPADGSVTTAKLVNSAVTYAKLQNVSTTDRLLGRATAGAGVLEEITCTSFGRSVLAAADATAGRTVLAAAPTASPTFTGAVTVPLGSIAAPGIALTGAANTGLYFASNGMGFSSGGARQFNILSTGEAGFGAAATSGIRLRADHVGSNASTTSFYCANIHEATVAGSYAGQSGQFHQFYNVATGVTNSGSGRALNLTSLRNFGTTTDAGTLTYLRGLELSFGHHNTAATTPTTTNVMGLLLQPHRGPGTIDAMYDLFINSDAISTGTITNHWAIYQAATTSNNYFGGKVGINTTTPASTLHVNGVLTMAAGSVGAPAITLNGDTNTGIYFPTADAVAISTGGVERFRVDSAGKTTIANLVATNLTVTALDGTFPLSIAEGRLTLSSGNPVPAANVASSTTLYYTPAVGNKIILYDTANTRWKLYSFSELSYSLAGLPANTNYDVFVYDNNGTLALQLAQWSSNTARQALGRLDGVVIMSGTGMENRRFVGTIRTSAAGTSVDSEAQRFVWNMHNQVQQRLVMTDSVSHTYALTTGVYRPWRNVTTVGVTRAEFVTGALGPGAMLEYGAFASLYNAAGVWLGLDSLTPYTAPIINTANAAAAIGTSVNFPVAPGYHYLQILQGGVGGYVGTFQNFLATPVFMG